MIYQAIKLINKTNYNYFTQFGGPKSKVISCSRKNKTRKRKLVGFTLNENNLKRDNYGQRAESKTQKKKMSPQKAMVTICTTLFHSDGTLY